MKRLVAGFVVIILYFCSVEGVTMAISPHSVYLQYTGQGQLAQTTFLCAGISAADVSNFNEVISLSISRSTRRETAGQGPTIIAYIEPGSGVIIIQTQETTDIQNRGTVTGTADSVDFTQSNLQLVIDSNAIHCDDVGQYTCTFTYRDTGLALHDVSSSMNLSVNALPSGVMLSARRYGATVEGPVNTPYLMNEGDEIEFTCSGNIGSSTSLQFQWWITGNMGLIKFRPEIQPNAVETQGEAMQGSTACTYSRTTTMRYNITAADRNRGSLTFMCFVQVNPPPPAQSYPQNSTAFYITIEGPPKSSSTDASTLSSTGPPCINLVDNKKVDAATLAAVAGTMGAIILILIAVVVLLVLVILKKFKCVRSHNKDLNYEVPNRAIPGSEERNYAALNLNLDEYEIATQ